MMGYVINNNTMEYERNETGWVAGNLTKEDQNLGSNVTTLELPGLNKGDIGFEVHSEVCNSYFNIFFGEIPLVTHLVSV